MGFESPSDCSFSIAASCPLPFFNCWHYYNSGTKARPVHWQDNEWIPLNCLSEQRFREIVGLQVSRENFGIYGLGENRTLCAYLEMCAISLDEWVKSCLRCSGDSLQTFMQTLEFSTKLETIRVSALHAIAYCPRLFYLEEVEELYTQDAAVFAGRRLHSDWGFCVGDRRCAKTSDAFWR